MRVDIETSGRSALAALKILGREMGRLPLSVDQARRVNTLLKIAGEHVAELVPAGAPPVVNGAPTRDEGRHIAGDLISQAQTAWAAAATLRHRPSSEEARRSRRELAALAARTQHDRVRKLCRQALLAS